MAPVLIRPPFRSSPRVRAVPSRVRRIALYRRAHARLPRLLRPRTFTEKLNWRIMFDRRELLAFTCDKLAMKEYVRRTAPGALRIPETYWSGTDVAALAAVDLPERWVLKPNHSCRRVLVGEGRPDPAELARRTAGWVGEQYWRKSEEWAYRRARPGLLVEQFVGVPGEVPTDLKVLVLGGVPRMVEVVTGRGRTQRVRLYAPDWTPWPWTCGFPSGPDVAPPERLSDMLSAAAALASPFDMLRVDFYEEDGRLWFGELTPYPGAGLSRLEPELNALLGACWTLPDVGPRRLRPRGRISGSQVL